MSGVRRRSKEYRHLEQSLGAVGKEGRTLFESGKSQGLSTILLRSTETLNGLDEDGKGAGSSADFTTHHNHLHAICQGDARLRGWVIGHHTAENIPYSRLGKNVCGNKTEVAKNHFLGPVKRAMHPTERARSENRRVKILPEKVGGLEARKGKKDFPQGRRLS